MGGAVLKRVFLLGLLCLPVVVWAFVKPVRVLAPELVVVTCAGGICVDDLTRLPEAQKLAVEAIEFVQRNVGQLQKTPRMVFCSSRECSRSFGLTRDGAYNVATVGVVISYRGWQPHFIRHELIHHLQNERLGSLSAWLKTPTWFKEGMAYSLSRDPRHPLPPPLEGHRTRYEAWARQVGAGRIRVEAERLQE